MSVLAANGNGEEPFATVIEALNAPGLYLKALLESEYNDHCTKYLFKAGVSAGEIGKAGLEMFVDLDDYFGITQEGRERPDHTPGWVTVWLVGNLACGVDVPLPTLGIVRLPGQTYDPDFSSEINTLKWTIITEVTGIELVSGETTNIDHLEWNLISTEISFTLADAVFPLAKTEIRKDLLDVCLVNAVLAANPIAAPIFSKRFVEELSRLLYGVHPELLIRSATRTDLDPSNPTPPDLMLLNPVLDCSLDVVQGTQVTVNVIVQNIGQSGAQFDLSFYQDSEENMISRYAGLFLPGDSPDPGISCLQKSVLWNTATVTPGPHRIIVRIEASSPTESRYDNNEAFISVVLNPSKPTCSITSISPNPAKQGVHTIVFTASADDPDDLGPPPEIRAYRWTSDKGKVNGELELYSGQGASFSMPASDLVVGTHTISLTAQDNEKYWSDPVTCALTIIQGEPAEGHDVAVGLYVSQAGVVHPPGSFVKGEVWAVNNGDYGEAVQLKVLLMDNSGKTLDSCAFPVPNLAAVATTAPYSFSLAVRTYEGDAAVRATAEVKLDEDWSNNTKTVPVYCSSNLNWTADFDGFEYIQITSGQEKTVLDRKGHSHTIKLLGILNPIGTHVSLVIDEEWFEPYCGDYIFLPWVVIEVASRDVGTWNYNFYLWWPDNLFNVDNLDLTVPQGGQTEFVISRSGRDFGRYDVEFLEPALPEGWTYSERGEPGKLTVTVSAPFSAADPRFYTWVHFYTQGVTGAYSDGFSLMSFQVVFAPPETTITLGPDGKISTRDATFAWRGSDDTTPASELQYSYRLEPLYPDLGSWTGDTEKIYNHLPNGEYTFCVKSRDPGGNEDPTPACRSFVVEANRKPDGPINEFPLSGQSGLSLTPPLVGSAFSDPDDDDTFAKSRFQIRSDMGTYDHPVWDSGEVSPGMTSAQVSPELPFGRTYLWRCQYQDNHSDWGPWSNETSFTVVDNPLPGDANMDCRVNILDLIFIRNRLGMDGGTDDNWKADVNADGKINLLDLLFVRNRLNQSCP